MVQKAISCGFLVLVVALAGCGGGGDDDLLGGSSSGGPNVSVTVQNASSINTTITFITVTRVVNGIPVPPPEGTFSGVGGPMRLGEQVTFGLVGGVYRFFIEWAVNGSAAGADSFDLLFVGGQWLVQVEPGNSNVTVI